MTANIFPNRKNNKKATAKHWQQHVVLLFILSGLVALNLMWAMYCDSCYAKREYYAYTKITISCQHEKFCAGASESILFTSCKFSACLDKMDLTL